MSHSAPHATAPATSNPHPTPADIGPEVYECSYDYHLPDMPNESMPDKKVVAAAKAAREEKYRTRHKRFWKKVLISAILALIFLPVALFLLKKALILTGIILFCIVFFPFI